MITVISHNLMLEMGYKIRSCVPPNLLPQRGTALDALASLQDGPVKGSGDIASKNSFLRLCLSLVVRVLPSLSHIFLQLSYNSLDHLITGFSRHLQKFGESNALQAW